MHNSRDASRRALTLLLVAGLALSGACSRRSPGRPAADGTEVGPFEGSEVDVRPKILGCEAGFLLASVGLRSRTAPGASPVDLLVDVQGRVVPGSVGQRREGQAPRPPIPAGMERDILTCRYSPGTRQGQPVAVWTTSMFNLP